MTDKIKAITDKEFPLVSNLANASAVLAEMHDINWCGFYIADGDTLYVGPFQGDPACVKIPFGKGVCGTAAINAQTVIVEDVHKFPGHIACSELSASEIVVPIIKDGKCLAVIDIDSPLLSRFDESDAKELEEIAEHLKSLF